jgi:hypothetical protein
MDQSSEPSGVVEVVLLAAFERRIEDAGRHRALRSWHFAPEAAVRTHQVYRPVGGLPVLTAN